MNKYIIMTGRIIISAVLIANAAMAQIAVKGEKIYTMAGEVIQNGIVLINEGKIEEVGSSSNVQIPSGYEIIEGKIVTPGLIDAHTVVGLSGIYNQKHDQDQLELSEAIQPELRAIDAFNPNEELLTWIRKFGVTTVNTGHAPGALSSGQTMIVKTTGSLSESVIDSVSAVVFSLGTEVSGELKTPGTRPKGIAMLRSAFVNAQNYEKSLNNGMDKGKDLRMEILSAVLKGDIPAIITANTAVDILGAIRLADEFKFKLILDGAAEAYLVMKEIKEANIPVILHPLMARTKNISYETPKLLRKENILFAVQGGYESYVPKVRNVLFEAAIASSNGLTFEEALASITVNSAEILGVNDRIGTIERGKDADLAVYDGDPFEYTSHCCYVIIDGKVVENECK